MAAGCVCVAGDELARSLRSGAVRLRPRAAAHGPAGATAWAVRRGDAARGAASAFCGGGNPEP
ncbi:hypothetical protein DIS09_06115 [Burkholderia pseudomallei]|nr:hypothetical protein DIS09_06115 [Burkholderia pseudomallei]